MEKKSFAAGKHVLLANVIIPEVRFETLRKRRARPVSSYLMFEKGGGVKRETGKHFLLSPFRVLDPSCDVILSHLCSVV